jgi:hypothetical protein
LPVNAYSRHLPGDSAPTLGRPPTREPDDLLADFDGAWLHYVAE